MAAKKEFDIKINPSTAPNTTGEFTLMAPSGEVKKAIAQGTHKKGEQPEVSDKEKAERMSSMRTQGRKGLKMPRINLAFTPENHAFVQLVAHATGRSITKTINDMITVLREANPEIIEQAQGVKDYFNSVEFTGKRND